MIRVCFCVEWLPFVFGEIMIPPEVAVDTSVTAFLEAKITRV